MDPMPPATGNLAELNCGTCRALTIHRKDDAGRWWCDACLRNQGQQPPASPPQAVIGGTAPMTCMTCGTVAMHQLGPDGRWHCLSCLQRAQMMAAMPPPGYGHQAPSVIIQGKRQSSFSQGVGLGCGCFTAIFVVIPLILLATGAVTCAGASHADPRPSVEHRK